RAQEPATPDSARAYQLQEVVIQGDRAAEASPATVQRVTPREVARADADVVAEFTRLIPAAHALTNSRGETLVYLRSGGERQTAFFLDGAPLNVPWDNRVDLDLVPAGVVGAVTVAKGPASIEYGANVLGGVINFASRAPVPGERRLEAVGRFGTQANVFGSLLYSGTAGRLGYTAQVGYARHDGFPVAGGADLPFSQAGDDVRTNTDARVANVYARGVYTLGGGTLVGLTLLHVDAEEGVAPEAHLDPALDPPRYWRYPLWRTTMAVLNAEGTLGTEDTWKAAAWAGVFRQHIASYPSDAYDRPEARQEDDDRTGGARFTLRHALGTGAVRMTASALTSTHDQRDLDLEETGEPVPGEDFPTLRYRQHLLSVGAAYEIPLTATLRVEAGAGLDASLMPLTGDKPERDPFADYNLSLGARYEAPAWFARAAAGRKTRFPTMRELFGEALRRFLLNPNLEPESSWLFEAGFGTSGARFSGEVIPFATFTANTIDQRNVTDSTGTTRRQRINLRGSRVVGVEFVGAARPLRAVEVTGHLTVMDLRRLRDAADDPERLAERPGVLGRLAAAYDAGRGPAALLEVVYTGRAYSLGNGNALVPLNPSLVLNARAAYRLRPSRMREASVEVFARVDNATDAVVTPQLGLPAPGRTAHVGVKVGL
ncbi:MAG TPA: TonB-dependent receptor, partial [Rubricoccaceae bacterium]|nr:TonB-dependent receptor [Rubricoccaceae bacterium]